MKSNMNKFKPAILIFTVVIVAIQSCSESSTDNDHPAKEAPTDLLTTNSITLKIGETFSIKLGQNGSIGLSNCWINQTKCRNVKIYDSYYVSSQKEKEGCEGCGGHVYWNFKAISEGVDTIKVKSCPTGRKQKSCEEFQEDSSSYKDMIKYTSKVDRAIVVRVVK